MNLEKLPLYAPLLLRFSLSAVFLWFGISQLTDPQTWAGIVPSWATNLSGLDASLIVKMNGIFEVLASILLIIGILVRYVAGLLAIHLFVIASGFGLSPTGVRDFGLAFATLSVALSGEDKWCLARKNRSRNS